jgi:hypothetical protein
VLTKVISVNIIIRTAAIEIIKTYCPAAQLWVEEESTATLPAFLGAPDMVQELTPSAAVHRPDYEAAHHTTT